MIPNDSPANGKQQWSWTFEQNPLPILQSGSIPPISSDTSCPQEVSIASYLHALTATLANSPSSTRVSTRGSIQAPRAKVSNPNGPMPPAPKPIDQQPSCPDQPSLSPADCPPPAETRHNQEKHTNALALQTVPLIEHYPCLQKNQPWKITEFSVAKTPLKRKIQPAVTRARELLAHDPAILISGWEYQLKLERSWPNPLRVEAPPSIHHTVGVRYPHFGNAKIFQMKEVTVSVASPHTLCFVATLAPTKTPRGCGNRRTTRNDWTLFLEQKPVLINVKVAPTHKPAGLAATLRVPPPAEPIPLPVMPVATPARAQTSTQSKGWHLTCFCVVPRERASSRSIKRLNGLLKPKCPILINGWQYEIKALRTWPENGADSCTYELKARFPQHKNAQNLRINDVTFSRPSPTTLEFAARLAPAITVKGGRSNAWDLMVDGHPILSPIGIASKAHRRFIKVLQPRLVQLANEKTLSADSSDLEDNTTRKRTSTDTPASNPSKRSRKAYTPSPPVAPLPTPDYSLVPAVNIMGFDNSLFLQNPENLWTWDRLGTDRS